MSRLYCHGKQRKRFVGNLLSEKALFFFLPEEQSLWPNELKTKIPRPLQSIVKLSFPACFVSSAAQDFFYGPWIGFAAFHLTWQLINVWSSGHGTGTINTRTNKLGFFFKSSEHFRRKILAQRFAPVFFFFSSTSTCCLLGFMARIIIWSLHA